MNPWPASCCSWEGTNTSAGDGTNTLDLTWYIFVHLTVFLPLLCILLTSMINLLFPSLKWWSDFQPPQCNASFGAQRAWVSCPCTSLSPGPGSISSVCGWAFPLNVPGSCSLVSFLLAHVLWTFAGCLHNHQRISWLACGPGICLWAVILEEGELVFRAVGSCFTCSAGSPRGLTPCLI